MAIAAFEPASSEFITILDIIDARLRWLAS